jgi:hypothetical protein
VQSLCVPFVTQASESTHLGDGGGNVHHLDPAIKLGIAINNGESQQ